MVKIQENPSGKQLFVNIPLVFSRAKGWKKGQELEFILASNNRVLLQEVHTVKEKEAALAQQETPEV